MRFEGRIVWVTGASSGIGEALAAAFAAEGARLVLSGRRREALEAVAGRIGGEALVLPFEATDWGALAGAVEQAWGWRGGVDILVNNAGVSQRSLAVDTAPEVYRTLIEVDLLAPIWLTQLLLPHMVERRRGHIVAISSVAGRVGPVLRTGYAAAKHGLIGYCDALRAEVDAAYGIKVTTVLPGSVRTSVAANALQADGSARGASDANIEAGMDPAECARRVVDAVAAGTRELIVAEGAEAFAAGLRFQDPEKLFDLLSGEGVRLARAREEAGGAGFRPEPMKLD
ncbi:MAG: SDR family NAD(P)-dependent oxidoreductase [Alphaproteobacteria bacterium]|nr:MAG: SDR family NAD(P)-dependent oxidoreductase [Alphaproteobacteria bacterium]